MEGPAPTLGYYLAGYTVIFIGLTGYVASLALRWRRLQRELVLLETQDTH